MTFPKNRPLDAVILDLDGTLLDSMSLHAAAWQEAFSEIRVSVESAMIYQNEGNLEWDILRQVPGILESGLESRQDFIRLCARQRDIYVDRYAQRAEFYPEAETILQTLKTAQIRLALVTSSWARVLAPAIRESLNRYFDVVVTRDQVERGKPHPDPYLTALKRLELDPGQAVAVENAPAGIQSAQGAGLTCLALTTTLTEEFLAAADLILPDHSSLLIWLQNRMRPPDVHHPPRD